ncbi:hypothetical protein PUND_a1505 [Pseudoalteromonas undina]|nr:hypothetical protein PUND_a1505 [Pseudoalteromonas undina]
MDKFKSCTPHFYSLYEILAIKKPRLDCSSCGFLGFLNKRI